MERAQFRRITGLAALAVNLVVFSPSLGQADTPPAPWVQEDIGSPPTPGSTQVNAEGMWTLTGTGSVDFGNRQDRFHSVYQRLKGDATITARFESMQGDSASGTGGKVALMVRTSNQPDAPAVDYVMGPYNTGMFARLERGQPNGFYGHGGPTNEPSPLWLRLQRTGNRISGFYSTDGELWLADLDPIPLRDLTDEALFGLLAVSNGDRQPFTGRFDQVQAQTGATLVPALRSCVRDRAVILQWQALPQAVAYNIYRGPDGADRSELVKVNDVPVTGTAFTDSGDALSNGTPLTYGIAAVFQAPDGSAMEGPIAAVPANPQAVPPDYLGCGILEGPHSGGVSYDDTTGMLSLQGSGFGIELNADQFYFLYRPLASDGQITVPMLRDVEGGSFFEKAGLMIRESLEGNARYAMVGLRPNDGPGLPGNQTGSGLVMGWRGSSAGGSVTRRLVPLRSLPETMILRLTRKGNTVTPEYSTDGGQHFVVGQSVTFDPPLPATVYVGPAITAGRAGAGPRSAFSSAVFGLPHITKP